MSRSPRSLADQTELFRLAADGASTALSTWLGRPVRIAIRAVRRAPLVEAAALLGPPEVAVVACPMQITGVLPGVLMLVCDDSSGLALAAMLLGREPNGAAAWDELAESAAVETANIIGCAYLNALVAATEEDDGRPAAVSSQPATRGLLPTPPWFIRDYAGAVMEAAVMTQAAVASEVFLTHTDFVIEGSPITCSLLFVPAAGEPG